jgi:MoxR-like ATPase
MPNDDDLRELLEGVADSSDGKLTFRATTAAPFARERGLAVRAGNPLYVFTLAMDSEPTKTFVAFTLSLNGGGRPATRVEALGKSLADTDGKLFDLNPFLLVYDYVGRRLLAVSAAELFDAFAKHAAATAIPYSESSAFSLSPNFDHGTISMYATVQRPTVWETAATTADISVENLTSFLLRVALETQAKSDDMHQIVNAIRARLAAAPAPSATPSISATVATASEDFAQHDPLDDAVQVDDRLWQMILRAIASYAGVILVGPPGTGKSALVRKAVATLSEARQAEGRAGIKEPLWATPDESWTARELIGGETVSDSEIVFRPGWVLRAIAEDRWLVLDEANRGDLDRIFGALLTWLAGGTVAVGIESAAEDAKTVELSWTSEASRVETVEGSGGKPGKIRYLASESDWKILGTYNALDAQRVFRIGAALGRRFVRIPIPPVSPDDFETILGRRAIDLPAALRNHINGLYAAHYDDEVTRVGPAQFLGMCPYLRSALQAQGRNDPDGGNDQASNEPTSEVMGSILSEAYVLNLGTLLAQLEEPDFEQLAQRVQASAALTAEEIEWVGRMMRSLA